MYIKRKMNKPIVVYPCNEILLSNEQERTTHMKQHGCQKHAEQKKLTKEGVLHDSSYMKF